MIQIRPETVADWEAIHAVTESAFCGKAYADGDEQELIGSLRELNALRLSLVAEEDGEIVGQVSFSPAQLSDGSEPWFALGPVAVHPQRQGEGIGSMLIERGLTELKKLGALGCILTGDPRYYQRFGFQVSPENCPEQEPSEFFMLKLLLAQQANGTFAFHPAFYNRVQPQNEEQPQNHE